MVEPITAENILRLFPDIDTTGAATLDGHDEEQIRLMDEVCIVLDENDKPIGSFSKKICQCICHQLLMASTNNCRPSHDQY
jgi:isopentenyl-diphosphate delta-isomerase